MIYLQSPGSPGSVSNPQTGKEIKIKAKKVPKFTAGKALKGVVK